jgi:selenocysteine-specific elongation factor
MSRLSAQGVNSSSVKDLRAELGDDVYSALLDLGQLVQLSADVVYPAQVYEDIVTQVQDYVTRNGRINVAELRDLFETSRKYAIAILEHLDDIRVTKRQGDYRQLVQ